MEVEPPRNPKKTPGSGVSTSLDKNDIIQEETNMKLTGKTKKYLFVFGLFLGLLGVAKDSQAATFYMCGTAASCNANSSGWGNGSDSNNGTSKSSPWLTLEHSYASMSAGDTLIIGDGTYTGSNNETFTYGSGIPPTSASLWTTIKAENPGGVLFDGQNSTETIFYAQPGSLTLTEAHWIFDGLVWANSNGTTVELDHFAHVKFLRCGAYNAGAGNNSNFAASHSSYILYENCYAYGSGRYKFIGWQSDHLIWRNCLGRIDHHDCQGEPMAVFSIYSISHALVQNSIAIDSDQSAAYRNVGGYGGCFAVYDTDMATDDNTYTNSVCLNSRVGGSIVAHNNPATNIRYDNDVFWNVHSAAGNPYTSPIHFSRATSGTFKNITFGNAADSFDQPYFLADTGTNNLVDSIFTGISLSGGASLLEGLSAYDFNDYFNNSNAPTLSAHDKTLNPVWNASTNPTGAIKYPVRIESGSDLSGQGQSGADIGANLIYQQGKSGTLWGEAGYNLPQDGTNGQAEVKMWPFPNEDIIKTKMAAYSGGGVSGARGFAAAGNDAWGKPLTLTRYIWQYLGNEIPCDVYGTCNGDMTPPIAPSGLSVM